MRIGFLISSAAVVRPTWTTAHLAHAALQDQHRVRIIEVGDMEITAHGRLVARTHVLDAPLDSAAELAGRLSSRKLSCRYVELSTLDMLLLRANPMSTHVLGMSLLAAEQGVRVHNDPTGIVRTRNKAWLASLPDIPRPRTIVTRELSSARLFSENLDTDVVLKPVVGSGGRGVVRVPRGNARKLAQCFANISRQFAGPLVVQAYAAAADQGEKRVFWVDGQIVGAYLRTRAPGAFLHNLQQGATPTPCAISKEDQTISDAITPHLLRNGIRIAGLDIIGGELIEVNTLNPGGVHYAETFRIGEDPKTPGGTIAARVIRMLTTLPTWNIAEANPA